MATPDRQLPLPAAVGADPVGLAVVVGREEALDRAEPRGLHVDGPWRPAEPLDVGDGMDRRVPGDTVGVRLEERQRLRGERRVLDPRLGKRLQHTLVEAGVGRIVDDRARVLSFEVDRVDAAELLQLADDRVGPVGPGVELEAERGVDRKERTESLRGWWVAEPAGGDEGHGPGRASDDLAERPARLAQREVERGALERPAAVVLVVVAVRRLGEQRNRLQVLREALDRPFAGKREHRTSGLLRLLQRAVVGDVLAEPLLARSGEPDHRRLPEEVGARRVLVGFEVVPLDHDREVADGVEQRHQSAAHATAISPARPAFATIRSRLTRRVSPRERSWSADRT